jgi:energy-coupling factor transporter ATP-binding protein EcfA2
MSTGSDILLSVRGISKRYGGVQAVKGLSFQLRRGEILGLLGPNGAGKTTAFNMIAGFVGVDEGEIELDGRRISGRKPWDVCAAGLARTFQLSKPLRRHDGAREPRRGQPGQDARPRAQPEQGRRTAGLPRHVDPGLHGCRQPHRIRATQGRTGPCAIHRTQPAADGRGGGRARHRRKPW